LEFFFFLNLYLIGIYLFRFGSWIKYYSTMVEYFFHSVSESFNHGQIKFQPGLKIILSMIFEGPFKVWLTFR